jgi:hypothetical protein
MKTIFTIVSFIALIILVVAIGPLLTIWAFNALFPSVAIPYSIETWVAVIILGAFFRANVSIKKKD